MAFSKELVQGSPSKGIYAHSGNESLNLKEYVLRTF